MSFSRIAVVTGANKGIGLTIVRELASRYPSSPLNNGKFLIYLSARDQHRGEEAVRTVRQDAELQTSKALEQFGGPSAIEYHAMDISKPQSIEDMVKFLKSKHPEGIDILINNAGIALDGFSADIVTQTLQCNYYGTLHATQSFLPIIRSGGRIVNMASALGRLNSKYSESLRERFANSDTVGNVTRLMEEFKHAVESGTHTEKGWPSSAYAVSKTGVIGMTRAIAKENPQTDSQVLINSCCPGYVKTDMTKGRGAKSVDQAADTPVMLALSDLGKTSGQFWTKRKITQW